MADTSGQWAPPTNFQNMQNMMATPQNSPEYFDQGAVMQLLMQMLSGMLPESGAAAPKTGHGAMPGPRDRTPPANPNAQPESNLPQALMDFLEPFLGTAPMTPEQIEAFGTAMTMGEMDLAAQEMMYQWAFLDLKADELGFSQSQLAQAKEEFEFQSGEYWDWFKGDYFEFQKEMEANQVAMSNNQKAMSDNQLLMSKDQLLMSKDDVMRSANSTLASQSQAEAAGYQAEAARYQAMVQMGLTNPGTPNIAGGPKSFNAYKMY